MGWRSARRAGLFASTAFAAVMLASGAAQAACTPAAANNVTATCTGTTTNAGAGYGGFGLTNLNVTVTPGATVTGTNDGLRFDSASVINFGTISGGSIGIMGNTVSLTNSGAVIGNIDFGIYSAGSAIVTNSGAIAAGKKGIWTIGSTTLVNSGTVTGGQSGIDAVGSATVTNSGTILGGDSSVSGDAVNVTNSGTIRGGQNGVSGDTVIVTNSGTIAGGLAYGVRSNDAGIVINAGTIIGGAGAILFSTDSDSLTILPGARFGGLVNFRGGADSVNFGPGSWILNTANFNAGLSSINTAGNPFVVTPTQIMVADLSSFGAMNRAVMDITGWMSSVLPDSPVFEPAQAGGANAFAAIESAAPRFDDAFASFSSALPYAPTPVFKGGTVNDAQGNSYWAKAFGGHREQDTEDNFIGSVTQGYGGAIGFDGQITANTRLGVLLGGSTNETDLDFNAGSIDTDTMFGGVYARTFFGATFLDLALIGGTLENDSKRNIGGSLAMETASASYDGWFVNPSLTLGHRFALPYNLTLTPALKVRYVAAHFDGYAETGSSANLTVADRDFHALEERAELTLANVQHWDDSRIVFRTHVGALAQQRTGDKTVNVALAGTNFIAATPDDDNLFGLYGGGGFDWRVGNVALFASGEVTGMNDNSTAFAGKAGLRMVW